MPERFRRAWGCSWPNTGASSRASRPARLRRLNPLEVRKQLAERLRVAIDRGATAPLPDAAFDELALALFAYQFATNPIYGSYCRSRGATPANVRGWLQIPAVPADAFKAAPLVCGDPATAAAAFRTSGTTRGAGRRGIHYLLDTAFYQASLRAGFTAHLLPEANRIQILSLVPTFEEAPDSSLSFMIADVIDAFGTARSRYFISGGQVDAKGFLDAGESAATSGEPVLVVGTSVSYVHLLDEMARSGRSVQLPTGSRAMDTGGFKGQSREVDRPALYSDIGARLGIPTESIVNEYGMTEMSSQLYDGVAGAAGVLDARIHRGPGWVRSIAVDPETLVPLPAGEVGILRHLDLANLDSVAAIQTADLGRAAGGGIQLLGRAEGAEPRGCSIAMDDLLAAMRQ